jgi:hypothetical protein
MAEPKEDESGVSNIGCFGALVIVLFVVWVVWPQSKPRSKSSGITNCVEKGVAYFKDIGSYPNLSTGRDARSVALERCSRTTKAFDLN